MSSDFARNCLASCRDAGAGVPEGFDARTAHGLGMKVTASLVQQLEGQLAAEGAKFTVVFPIAHSS